MYLEVQLSSWQQRKELVGRVTPRRLPVISQTAEYALRAVVALGSQRGAQMTTRQIASRTLVPAGYLSKVLQALGRAGLVEGQRGAGGGFALARPQRGITVLDVINAVDPLQRIERCPLGRPEHQHKLCALHRRLDLGIALMEQIFGQTTIHELLDDEDPIRSLCEGATGAGRARVDH
jgi:Rrf2 family transcriptional regulator, nitric oxide-sensitive transcriptional repressor